MFIPEGELDVMAELKAQTADAHRQIERLMPFFDEACTVGRFKATMLGFLGFFQPMERTLAAMPGWEAVGIDMTKRQRSQLLRADLRALGMPDSAINATAQCGYLPTLRNRAAGLGCLYVLEGSTLGGQLIAREMKRRFGIDQSSGTSFFVSHGEKVGEMWRDFCRVVQEYVNTTARITIAVRAANETFQSLETWMRRVSASGE